mmetsp:Transcript_42724/g.134806  ORF Transcript_42724/g.134806 Transcript_42724/m.134806 type:complete len:239 (+) Transcript_42724:839-1555(+)
MRGREGDPVPAEPLAVAKQHLGRADAARQPVAGARAVALGRGHAEALRAGVRGDGLADRVLRCGLGGAGELEELRPRQGGQPRGGVDHAQLARGERAGLVEDDGGDARGRLEHVAALEEDAALGADAGADHHGGGRGEPHRARAGDDEHGAAKHEGERRGTVPSVHRQVGQQLEREEGRPTCPREEGERDHRRHEDGRDAVGEGLHVRPPHLRVRHDLHDLGEHRLVADGADAHPERA